MKKKLLSFIVICLGIFAFGTLNASAGTYGDLTYEITDGEVTITGCNKSATTVEIPSEIEGCPVTSIGDQAFSFCENLTSITIPDSVADIDEYAFGKCTSLTSVTIPDSVTSIGVGVFEKCTSLTSITIPDSVTSIGDMAFLDCDSLKSITIPDSVTSIGYMAFERTGYYNNSANWENDVLYIGKHLIVAKRTITGSYDVKEGTLIIANNAFHGRSSLTNITMPNSITHIGNQTFSGCNRLTSITMPNSIISIGKSAFDNCDRLMSMTISNNVTHIGDYAFSDCINLTNVIIPDGVATIGDGVFSDCIKLKSIIIPDSVVRIGDYAFSDCDSLSEVTYLSTVRKWNEIEIGLGNERLLNNVTPLNPYTTTTHVTASSGEKIFITIPSYLPENALVILACYKEDRFVELKTAPNKNEAIYFIASKDFDTAKVMVWDSFSGMEPITEPEILE